MRRVVSPWPKKWCWFHLPGRGLCLPSSLPHLLSTSRFMARLKTPGSRGRSTGRDSWWRMLYNERTAWFCQFMLIRAKETCVEWFQMVWDQIGRENKVGSSQTGWYGPLKQRFQIQCICSRGGERSNSLPVGGQKSGPKGGPRYMWLKGQDFHGTLQRDVTGTVAVMSSRGLGYL